jgi:hypothetical protein
MTKTEQDCERLMYRWLQDEPRYNNPKYIQKLYFPGEKERQTSLTQDAVIAFSKWAGRNGLCPKDKAETLQRICENWQEHSVTVTDDPRNYAEQN